MSVYPLQSKKSYYPLDYDRNSSAAQYSRKSTLLVFDNDIWRQYARLKLLKDKPPPYTTSISTAATTTTAMKNNSKKATYQSFFYDLGEYVRQEMSLQRLVHSMDRPFTIEMGRKERIMWALVLILSIIFLIYIIVILAGRFQNSQLTTVIDSTKYPVFKIPFPEITICNRNHLNWSRLSAAKNRFLQKQHATPEYEAFFTDVILLYDRLTFGDFDTFINLTGSPMLTALNYINFTNVVEFMSWRCDEILLDCRWRGKAVNCCDIFYMRNSQLGVCLAFNSVETEQGQLLQRTDAYYPWHNADAKRGSGLNLRMLMNEQSHAPSKGDKGAVIMISEPNVWFTYSFVVSPNTKNDVVLNGFLHFYDNNTKNLDTSVRKCVFHDELQERNVMNLLNHPYMYENCQSECQQVYSMRYCNCSMDIFFPPSVYPGCTLSDLPCMAKQNNYFLFEENEDNTEQPAQNVMRCNCLYNCQSLEYITDVRSTNLKSNERLPNDSIIELDFYYKRNFILSFRTSLKFTWVDLLVSFGGCATLFLGCSMVSIFDLFYFYAVDVTRWIWKATYNPEMPVYRSRKIEENIKQWREEEEKRKY